MKNSGDSSRPKIAFYMRLLYGGGAERVVINLMAGMVAQGIDVDLVLNTVSGPFLEQVPEQVNIVDLSAPRMIQGLPKLANYLRQVQPNALITGLHFNSEIAIWAKLISHLGHQYKGQVLVIEHNTISIHSKYRKTDRWAPLLARLSYRWADHLVGVSHGAVADLSKVIKRPESTINMVYNPIITPQLVHAAQEPVEHAWFQPGQPPIILGIGRLEPQKDFDTLIRAFYHLKQHVNCRLVILGAGRQKNNLQTLMDQLDLTESVAFLGFVANPYQYLARAQVFALSSAWEGLSNVLVEALALQVPVVSTDCPSGPAEILAHGRYGKLVPVGEPLAMAEAIAETLAKPCKPVSDGWLKQFTQEVSTSKYLEILNIKACPLTPNERPAVLN